MVNSQSTCQILLRFRYNFGGVDRSAHSLSKTEATKQGHHDYPPLRLEIFKSLLAAMKSSFWPERQPSQILG